MTLGYPLPTDGEPALGPPSDPATILATLAFVPLPEIDQMRPRWCGYVDAIQRDVFLLKVLWPGQYPRENEGLDAGEVAIVLGRALPDGRSFRYRLAIPEDDAQAIYSTRQAQRLELAKRLFSFTPREREAFFEHFRWRRREGRPAKACPL